jgi:hypothetical protein
VDRMFVEDIIENLHWNLVYEVKLTWHGGSYCSRVYEGGRTVAVSACHAINCFLSSYYQVQWFRAYVRSCSWGSCWELGFLCCRRGPKIMLWGNLHFIQAAKVTHKACGSISQFLLAVPREIAISDGWYLGRLFVSIRLMLCVLCQTKWDVKLYRWDLRSSEMLPSVHL